MVGRIPFLTNGYKHLESGQVEVMKFIMLAAAAAFSLAGLTPALADNMPNHMQNQGHMAPHRPMPQRDPHKFHQGQMYKGHKLMYKNGYWGYQQPSNGVFIHINL